MTSPAPPRRDHADLAGCPLWVAALFFMGYGVMRIGVAEMFYSEPDWHLVVGTGSIVTAALLFPYWRRAGLFVPLAAALVVYEMAAPATPAGRMQLTMLVPALGLLVGGWWLYRYLSTGAVLRAPPGYFGDRFESGTRRRSGRRAAAATPPFTPQCFRSLGLTLPCTYDDVRRAYRQLARDAHPDRGGDPEAFHRLREAFEQAGAVLAARQGRIRPRRR